MQLKILFFHISKMLGLFHLARFLMRRRLLILCFHGIALGDEAAFRPSLFLDEKRFRQRLDTLRRHRFPVYRLDDALEGMNTAELASNPVVITIDDGFYNALAKAAPILHEQGLPATLYVTTYYVQHPAPIFRLVVQYLFWKTERGRLEPLSAPWSSAQPVDLADAAASYRAMWEIIDYGEQACDEAGREQICRRLGEALGVDYGAIIASRILGLLRPEELAQIEGLGVDLQLHTHRHRLPPGDEQACHKELRDNRAYLEQVLGTRKVHLCYPSGEWDQHLWPCLEDEGIESAVTCEPGLNTPETPRLVLYRVLDRDDLSQIEFEAELFGFCELLRIVSRRRS